MREKCERQERKDREKEGKDRDRDRFGEHSLYIEFAANLNFHCISKISTGLVYEMEEKGRV